MNTIKQLLGKLQGYKHYDKVQHVAAGLLVSVVYYFMVLGLAMYSVLAQSQFTYLYLMMTPHFLVGIVVAAFVHASKEANDYLAKLRGENHEVSVFDFLAGMAGSLVGLYLLF